MTKRIEVAAGVIVRPDGRFVLGQRAPGTFYPGFWEFPGGKVEPGESPAQALVRELDEELGIRVRSIRPWLTREYRYEHAHVRLHFFEVSKWEGELNDHVHTALSWERADRLSVAPMLPANGPVMKALRLPRFMGITQAGTIGPERQLELLAQALAGGLRLVQVREPALPTARLASFAEAVLRLAHPFGAIVLINGHEDLARELAADGVHLSSTRLAQVERRPDFEWVGASCHERSELERAAALGLDYALLGAVRATPTHPVQEGLGWPRFADRVRELPIPVLALGGLGADDMEAARDAGAHGIAAIRGAWSQSGSFAGGVSPVSGGEDAGTR